MLAPRAGRDDARDNASRIAAEGAGFAATSSSSSPANKVPADLPLVRASGLSIEEAILTGESAHGRATPSRSTRSIRTRCWATGGRWPIPAPWSPVARHKRRRRHGRTIRDRPHLGPAGHRRTADDPADPADGRLLPSNLTGIILALSAIIRAWGTMITARISARPS